MERVMPTEVPRDIQSQALVWPKLSAAMGYARDMTISLKTWKIVAESHSQSYRSCSSLG